jgi:dihydroorotate dehydrogenase (fumarate)
VEHVADLVAYLLAGADVVMTTSALLRHGPKHAQVLLDGLEVWMRHRGFDTVEAMRGLLATPTGEDHTEHERSGYVSAMRKANSGGYGSWWVSNRRHG